MIVLTILSMNLSVGTARRRGVTIIIQEFGNAVLILLFMKEQKMDNNRQRDHIKTIHC